MAQDSDAQDPDARDGTLSRGLAFVTNIVAPTTLLAALLYYFGYVETDSFYEYFGVDAATLQFSSQDYLLRSVGALYVPVGVVLLCALVVVWWHPAFVRALRDPAHRRARRARRALTALTGVGAVILVFGLVTWVLPTREGSSPLATPLCLAVGILLFTYTRLLERQRRPGAANATDPRNLVVIGVTVALAIVSAFWAANPYAERYGRAHAVALGRQLSIRPAVLLDTREELFLQLPGVTETKLPTAAPGQTFRFRYRGLRLLAQSGSHVFLVADDWSRGNGTLMLTADNDVRIQFSGG